MILSRIVIAQHERGLVLKDKRIHDILMPGIYWRWNFGSRIEVLDTKNAEVSNPELHKLLDSTAENDLQLIQQYLSVVELSETELALVYQRKALRQVLTSGTRHVFWKHAPGLEIKLVDTKQDYRVDKSLANILARRSGITGLLNQVTAAEVGSKQLGLLWVDGELVDTLDAGLHAFWKTNRSIKVELMELRLQNLEIAGQEILTRDKVSLRLNLSASYQVTDGVRARLQLKDYEDYLYRQLQFALREAVGTKTLDSLLADKEALNGELFRSVVKQMAEYGIKVSSVGVKDIILPGEMKEILNHVVATEKAAQANVIRRREETAATRSLLNTAKLMESNPTLLRLKELETLEKVVEKVDKISVFDGLNGLLRDTVKLQV
ncbi:slipin family protein [Arenicella xantha]|uniref:SPFH domain-containing protein n=1 Tax=Arenicella xantha TaxID=644221 RepID=A0A395JJR1_9GAMM|nr:slipin family protein [Arenicella xantha]RBP51023.1 SPFH domain-containing protein [Arenicella xantha]